MGYDEEAEAYKKKIVGEMIKSPMTAGVNVLDGNVVNVFCIGGANPKTLIMVIQSLRQLSETLSQRLAKSLDIPETELQELFERISSGTNSTEVINQVKYRGKDVK